MRTDLTLKDLPPMSKEEKTWWDEHNSEYCHYFYRIDNIKNKMFYYGIHSERFDSGKAPEEDGYMGSGTDLKKAQDAEGIENFKKTILKTFSTRDEARLEEMIVVDEDLILNPMCYNLALGGGINNSAGTMWITNGQENRKIPVNDTIPNGWRSGRFINAVDREAMSNGNKVKYTNRYTLETRFLTKDEFDTSDKDTWFTSSFFKEDGNFVEYEDLQEVFKNTNSWAAVARSLNICIESVKKIKSYYIDKGYKFTSSYKKTRPADLGRWSSRMKDKIYINNGEKYKVVNIGDLEKYLQDGWKIGKVFLSDLEIEKIIEEFIDHPSVRDLSTKLHRSLKTIKDALGFDGTEKIVWVHRGSQISRTKIPSKISKRFYSSGWKKK